ncbi:MAG: SIS domain-containing protein [Clostridia bacterium]|nr:SIS domain-containing protein [Clostridia bacterium]
MFADNYITILQETIQKAWDEQKDIIGEAAEAVKTALTEKHSVFIFGCSHAGILAEEVFYRTGGLAVINPIFFPGFMLNTRPITMTSQLERLDGLGKILVKENRLKKGDVLIIHSVSGRNNVPVEMAEEAKALGVKTIAVTNIAYSSAVTSRHPSGKRLFEVCDIVIDNKGCVGDAAVTLEGLPEKIGPTSTACGAALINALVIETVGKMLEEGKIPPVFLSANLDGGDEHNKKIFEEYKDSIFYN